MNENGKILIVDDSMINRSLLIDILCNEYEIVEAENGEEAIQYIETHLDDIALILLDIIMPKMNGFEVLSFMNKNGWIHLIPVIMITSETNSQSINSAYNMGVTDYINRPFDELIVQKRVNNTILLYAKQKHLEDIVTAQILEKEKNNLIMVEILSHIVEFRNGESGLHVLRIRIITELLMRNLCHSSDRYSFTSAYIAEVMNASALHDIGKIMIAGEILNKPGKLTKEEFEIMKGHSAFGAQMLDDIPFYQQEGLIKTARDICRWHHERYDGGGYPDHLSGEQIPICAQVVSLADVYDALTSKRVYKPAYTHEKAMDMILHGECGIFNPELLQCLIYISEQLKTRIAHCADKDALLVEEERNINEHILKDTKISNRTLALLEQERSKFKVFASMSSEILFEYDRKANMLTFSEWGANYFNLPASFINPWENPTLMKNIAEADFQKIKLSLHAAQKDDPVCELITQLKVHEEWRWFRIVTRPLWDHTKETEIVQILGKCLDIHEDYQKLCSLQHAAQEDTITHLWKHEKAKKRAVHFMNSKQNENYALILLDIDNFKNANTLSGHQFGDEILSFAAQKIQQCIPKDGIAAHISGDEFLLFLRYDHDIKAIIHNLYHEISNNYKDFQIQWSMGIALYPFDGICYDILFQKADQALIKAKKAGKGQYCLGDEMIACYHEAK